MDPLNTASPEDAQGPGQVGAAAPASPDVARLSVASASLADWYQVAEWAAAEGWNPGHRDADCFHATDPAGFFIGRLAGELVSAVSVVNYSDAYAFLGFYLVHPDHRGRGLGLATWRAAMPHAGNRLVGLDAVPAQEATYQRSGFTAVYRTTRYAGVPERAEVPGAGVVPVGREHLAAITGYDRKCFPTERGAFVERWLTAEGHAAYVWLDGGHVAGYGVIRPARDGWRVGPLFADGRRGAEALFDALTSHLAPGETVHVDVPDPRSEAGALVAARGLRPDSTTARMYTGPAPQTAMAATYAVTSLELG
ncbi:GNAT family N-acetyltransferase [Streptomyces sp. 71268]|uniref:GNAT family N-acetyltransferase n=1 Tax=Streptomyces sp. 71268 TaxID=3002640 RepID=UPI0023F90D80|nr:GNAT family N-acetyltransferase [Streptomyces sp. 71268]WEV23908.1 GNAT family N-acetyltransferase [Streptomyces sp. 71268]